MRRYITYILLSLAAFFCIISCIEEMESPLASSTDKLTLIPRVTSFTNQYITKAANNEGDIRKLAVLVFNESGHLTHSQESASNTTSVSLNRSMLNRDDMSSSTIVMIANMDLEDIQKADGTKLSTTVANKSVLISDLEDYVCHFDNIFYSEVPDAGFPMIGGLKGVDLTPDGDSEIQINLQILFAKVNLQIAVKEGTENALNETEFTLTGATVTNLANATPFAIPTEIDMPACDFLGDPIGDTNATVYGYTDEDYVITEPSQTITSTQQTVKEGSTSSKYTFYIAENRYNHGGTAEIYPSDSWLTSDLYDNYKQQYKPKLARKDGGEGVPTYITVTGKYKDYRSKEWAVNYTVYLGKNNYDNFHIDRNSEYTNYITIKGIRNNNSYKEYDEEGNLVDQNVWIDHRVDVDGLTTQNSAADHVTITRETLIDSHIEVRPLRVKWSGTTYGFARIYMPYYTENNGQTWSQRDETASKKNWIGIELNDKTGSLYCSPNNETTKGKRKYFTDALIPELNTPSINTDIVAESGQDKFIVLNNNECAWIYIDEYIYQESSTTVATSDRMAMIAVDFCTISNDGDITVHNREEYILHQQPLIKINNKYYLENYEEYLHSYDSHDKYKIDTQPTDYTGPGLQWGKSDRMSKSQFVTKKLLSDWSDWAPTNNEAYDFIHATDAADESLSEFVFVDSKGNSLDLTNNTGVNFTYNATENNGISISSMGEMPESAYQYCLSKNKFIEGADGENHKMKVSWYVPDVYELSEIFKSSNSPLSDDSFYWSSQAPYDITQSNILSATIASERVSEARVVSKDGEIDTKGRSEMHRIRCLYTFNGKEADMSARTPEGIGGLIKIPMTVTGEGFFDYDPWFTNLGTETKDYPDPKPTYRFPMGDTYTSEESEILEKANSDFGGTLIEGTHYYAKYPLDMNNWGKRELFNVVYYSMIHHNKWPGLTSKNTTPIAGDILEGLGSIVGQDPLATLETTDKMIERSVTTRSGKKIESMPINVNAVPLDHNEESEDKLTIAFNKGANSSNTPKYEYYNEDGKAAREQKWVKYWNVPEFTSKDFPSNPQSHAATPQPVTYTVTEVEDAIDRAINGILGGLNMDSENCELKTYSHTPVTTSSIYSYQSPNTAKNAGEEYFNNTINVNKEYSKHSVSTTSQTVVLCEYTYTYDKYKREWQNGSLWPPKLPGWGEWKYVSTETASGNITKTLYTYVITYQKPDGTYFRYVAGTGGWDEDETPLSNEEVTIDPEKPNVDALTFYAGNTFTISCTKPNHYIRSVKVNYNTSTIEDGEEYLRFVDNSKELPDENEEPEQMTYLDGISGWSKWHSTGDDTNVTLRLVIYEQEFNVRDWFNPNMVHKDPSSISWPSDHNKSLIITSLEIRLEEVKPPTN